MKEIAGGWNVELLRGVEAEELNRAQAELNWTNFGLRPAVDILTKIDCSIWTENEKQLYFAQLTEKLQ